MDEADKIVIDVGPGKEAADAKIRGKYQFLMLCFHMIELMIKNILGCMPRIANAR